MRRRHFLKKASAATLVTIFSGYELTGAYADESSHESPLAALGLNAARIAASGRVWKTSKS